MNKPALSPVLATMCIATLSVGSAAAADTELQLGPSDLRLGAEFVNKHYDQGRIRNENVTAIGHLDARYWDVGVHLDWYLAVNSDKSQPEPVAAGETTQISFGVDYLFEMQDVFQIIPHVELITYPNVSDVPYKNGQQWFGVDGWYLLPWPGLEIGASFDYNPFYRGDTDETTTSGGLEGHALRGALMARQFYQNAPLDVAFYEVLNFGNGEYKTFVLGEEDTGLTTLDLGVRYLSPFFLNDLWMTARLEAHIWLEADDRQYLRDTDKNTSEVIIAIGFEYRP